MTIDKHNATQQERQQPLPLWQALRCRPTLGDLDLPVRISMPNSRRQDPNQERAFLLSILEQALEIANDVDADFSEESSSEYVDGEQEENSRNEKQ